MGGGVDAAVVSSYGYSILCGDCHYAYNPASIVKLTVKIVAHLICCWDSTGHSILLQYIVTVYFSELLKYTVMVYFSDHPISVAVYFSDHGIFQS